LIPDLTTGNDFDPKTATREIRTGVSEGNGGTLVASGTGNINLQPTGRDPFGFVESTLAVKVTPQVTLTANTYWINVNPQCTNSANVNCSSLQPPSQIFFNSAFFGFTWANWCDSSLGVLPSGACKRLSFGVIGIRN
jgi:hypothetical protein